MNVSWLDKEYAEQKLRSCLRLVKSIMSSDWAYADSRDALTTIQEAISLELSNIEKLDEDADPDVIVGHCKAARAKIKNYQGYIGFILRSGNIRNAFEAYYPLRQIGHSILGHDFRLIIGSEWNYSPFVYPIPDSILSHFVLVGIPATEAQNALLIPVAGHEFGHEIWRRGPIGRSYIPKIKEAILDEIKQRWDQVKEAKKVTSNIKPEKLADDIEGIAIWSDSFELAKRQVEEVFCDCVGLWIFGCGFMHSFRYLLAPDSGIREYENYPTSHRRAMYLQQASIDFGDVFGSVLADAFIIPDPSKDSIDATIADEVTSKFSASIINEVKEYLKSKNVRRPSTSGKDAALARLRTICPADNLSTIADVINAAWEIRLDLKSWSPEEADAQKKLNTLNDLVFKSFEVMEWLEINKT